MQIALGCPTLAGNHERNLLEGDDTSASVAFGRLRLSAAHLSWIKSLPKALPLADGDVFASTAAQRAATSTTCLKISRAVGQSSRRKTQSRRSCCEQRTEIPPHESSAEIDPRRPAPAVEGLSPLPEPPLARPRDLYAYGRYEVSTMRVSNPCGAGHGARRPSSRSVRTMRAGDSESGGTRAYAARDVGRYRAGGKWAPQSSNRRNAAVALDGRC